MLEELHAAVAFIAMRNRAMRSGEVDALFYVYKTLKKYDNGAVTLRMRREYEKKWERVEEMIAMGLHPEMHTATADEIKHTITLTPVNWAVWRGAGEL
jgi:hypothetical protein